MAFIYILRKWSLICRAWFLIAHWQFSVNWSYWALEMRKHYCCMDDELKAITLLITTFLPEHFQLWHLTLLFFFVLIQLNSVLFSAKSQKPLLRFALKVIVSKPYAMTGLTTFLSTFTVAAVLLSQTTLVTPPHLLQPVCAPFFNFLVHCQLLFMADPRYLN